MYVPKAYSVDDLDLIHTFIRQNSFGILISVDGDHPVATHIPLLLNSEQNFIEGHLAKPNPHCALLDGRPVTCIFAGPHAYVSSLWYESQPNVPTWNYTAVHVHGRAQAITDQSRTEEILRKTVETYDPKLHNTPQSDADEAYFHKLVKGLSPSKSPSRASRASSSSTRTRLSMTAATSSLNCRSLDSKQSEKWPR